MIIVPNQCRMAREALNWKQKDLANKAKVAIDTISSFERELRNPMDRTLRDIKTTFEQAGIIFENDDEGVGVKLINQNSDQEE